MRPLACWSTRFFAAAIIVGALVYVPYRVYGSDGYVKYRGLRRTDAELAATNEGLRQENLALRREVKRLRDDLDAVAAVARDELGFVRPGEIVIQIERGPAPSTIATREERR